MSDLILFQFESCPFCAKVRQKLAELSIEYEKVEVETDRSKRPPEVMESGGTVPVLKDGDKIISDSSKIIAYLDDHYGK